jgi:hypothetical protein
MGVGAKIAPKTAQRSVIFAVRVKSGVWALFFSPKLRRETVFTPSKGRTELCRKLYDRLTARAPCSRTEAASRCGVRRSLNA